MALTAQEREAIAAQAPDRNTCGRAIAMTLANPVKPGRSKVLRLNFWVTGRVPALLGRLRKPSFIHFAGWTIVQRYLIELAVRAQELDLAGLQEAYQQAFAG
jgi:hypothetical protein